MTDQLSSNSLVQRLRHNGRARGDESIREEAADEIERLREELDCTIDVLEQTRAERDRLRGEVRTLRNYCVNNGLPDETAEPRDKARTAMAVIYQVLGALGHIAGHFATEDVQDALDVASRWESMTIEQIEALLPWPQKELAKHECPPEETSAYRYQQNPIGSGTLNIPKSNCVHNWNGSGPCPACGWITPL